MLEAAANANLVSTISLKRNTPFLQPPTSGPADYPSYRDVARYPSKETMGARRMDNDHRGLLHLIPRTRLHASTVSRSRSRALLGHCWTVFYCSFRNSWMPAKGLSVSPKSAIRSRPFKLSQGDCRPPCRRHPNEAVSSAVGRPGRWSTQEEMRRHNHCVHSRDLCCRFSQFFILARGTVPV
jgi:hypothetical protein